MRISDWSSDVCSSDLLAAEHRSVGVQFRGRRRPDIARTRDPEHVLVVRPVDAADLPRRRVPRNTVVSLADGTVHLERLAQRRIGEQRHVERSEEHTSELQSLMRISYAVFCLKKKRQRKPEQ